MKKHTIMLLILLLAFNAKSFGAKKIYDLDKTIEIAIENNYDLLMTEAQIESASANLRAAFGNYLPNINLSAGYNRVLSESLSPNTFTMGGSSSLIIFDGFGREAEYSIAKERVKSTEYNIKHTRQYITYQIYVNYINLIRNWQIVKIRRENLKLGQTELEQIKARYQAGIIAIDAVYTQEADLGSRESQLIQAENDYDISKASLLTLMGLDPTTECEFLESSLPADISDIETSNFRANYSSFNELVNTALKNRYDYKSAQSNIFIAEQSVKQAYSVYSPSLNANVNWGWLNTKITSQDSKASWTGGVSLQVPIFNRFKPNSGVQSAKLQLTEQEINIKKAEQKLKQDIQNTYLNLSAAEKQLDVTRKSTISAKQNYESMKERFNVGAATMTDLTMANTQLITAQINAVNAVYNYIFAQKGVLFAIGSIN